MPPPAQIHRFVAGYFRAYSIIVDLGCIWCWPLAETGFGTTQASDMILHDESHFSSISSSVIWDSANMLHHMGGRWFFPSFTVISLVLCNGKHLKEQSALALPDTLWSAWSDVLHVWVETCCQMASLALELLLFRVQLHLRSQVKQTVAFLLCTEFLAQINSLIYKMLPLLMQNVVSL